MANLDQTFLIVALCFAFMGAALARDIGESMAPASLEPDEDNISEPELPPEPSPGYYHFLDQCAQSMTPECSKEIFASMYDQDDFIISMPCCSRLVSMGKECHDGMVKALLMFPQLRPVASTVWTKSQQIWSICASDYWSPSPS